MDARVQSEFTHKLLAWFEANRRVLPWRESPSLYKTVVSEFMLQQTQVATVLPYFERWLARFPDFERLAGASEEDVVKAWEGLGYYRRARNLHKLAKAWVAAKIKPACAEDWLVFPGVGAYTAAAIASIAQGEAVAVVDGNVVRVITRILADETEYKDNTRAMKVLTPHAKALLHPERAGAHNEAMMELGATVCTKHNPLCTVCPVVEYCEGACRGIAGELPRLASKKVEKLTRALVWCVQGDALLLAKGQGDARRLADIWELPEPQALGLKTPKGKARASRTRGISNQRILEKVYAVTPTDAMRHRVSENECLRFVPLGELEGLTLSGPHRRWVQELLNQD